MTTSVVRVGDTVRRPVSPASPVIRGVLRRLELAGFDDAPRWLGVDEQGRDVLSWIEGETFTERGRMHPYLDDAAGRIIFSQSQVCAAMALLRRFHDALGDDLLCHGDFGPWNIVWRDELPHAVIDFDAVRRADPSEDVGYALRMFIGYGRAEAEPLELVAITRAAVKAFGAEFDVPVLLGKEYERAAVRCRENGWTRQLAILPLEQAWLSANRDLF